MSSKSITPPGIIETVLGRTRDDCIKKIFDKYGKNYTIDGMRTVLRRGFLGIQKEYIEIKYHAENLPELRASPYGMSLSGQYANAYSAPQRSGSPSSADFMRSRAEILNNAPDTSNIQFKKLFNQIENMSKNLDSIKQATMSGEEHKNIKKIQDLLDDNGFTRTYIEKMCARLKNELSLDELDDFERVQSLVVDWIGEGILIDRDNSRKTPKVIVIVGPTGVGKTTTVAKMAARIAVSSKNNSPDAVPPKIRMITIDTMRVAAVEQLSHWAEIIGVNVDQAESSSDLQTLYRNYSGNADYIFIDTSGYSPNDFENIARMRKILNVENMQETVYLAIVAGINARDLENIIRNYEGFNFKSVIITKCDETSTYGNVLSVLSEKNKSIAWITSGQEVLHTIERGNRIRFLRGLRGFNVDMNHLREKFGETTDDIENR